MDAIAAIMHTPFIKLPKKVNEKLCEPDELRCSGVIKFREILHQEKLDLFLKSGESGFLFQKTMYVGLR